MKQFFEVCGKKWTRQAWVRAVLVNPVLEEYGIEFRENINPFPGELRGGVDWWCPQQQLAIEYNGRNHYEPVRWYGIPEDRAEAILTRQLKSDAHKAETLASHGVQLLVIRWDDDLSPDAVRARLTSALGVER